MVFTNGDTNFGMIVSNRLKQALSDIEIILVNKLEDFEKQALELPVVGIYDNTERIDECVDYHTVKSSDLSTLESNAYRVVEELVRNGFRKLTGE